MRFKPKGVPECAFLGFGEDPGGMVSRIWSSASGVALLGEFSRVASAAGSVSSVEVLCGGESVPAMLISGASVILRSRFRRAPYTSETRWVLVLFYMDVQEPVAL